MSDDKYIVYLSIFLTLQNERISMKNIDSKTAKERYSWSQEAKLFSGHEIAQTEAMVKREAGDAFDPIFVDFALYIRSNQERRRL